MSGLDGLGALQLALRNHVLDATGTPEGMLRAAPGIDTAMRLGIYRNAYRARLTEALRDTFGHTATYLGGEAFGHVAGAYIDSHPSTHANLRWFGSQFEPWLRLRHGAVPEAAELAALDWALRRAFDGPDARALVLADLAAVAPGAWPGARLGLHPTAELLRMDHNSIVLWHAIDSNLAPPACLRLPEPARVLVWRNHLQPHFRSLGRLEGDAIEMVVAGATFGALCERLAGQFPEVAVAAQVGAMLRRWVEDAMLTVIDTQGADIGQT
ncbi:MAG: DNA-binding domain-containing protein [Usitatibacter sp.]